MSLHLSYVLFLRVIIIMIQNFIVRLMTTIALLIFSAFIYSAQIYTPESPNWLLENEQVTVEEIAGKKAIKIRSGRAMLKDVLLENGTVEFQMYLPKERAFAYLYFRGASEQDIEALYIRTHKSKAPDAIQYAPVFQRRSAWQLYHGNTGTAAVEFPSKTWFSVKVELAGQQMKVWVGESPEPVLDIKHLGHTSAAGWLAFRGFVPRTSDAQFSAYFSEIKITKSDKKPPNASKFPPLPVGQITQWRVSPAFDSPVGPITEVSAQLRNQPWSTPAMQHNGVFEFLRSRTIPKGSRHWSVVAEVTLVSKVAQTCAVHFGFSDELNVSVNEQQILYQDDSYRFIDNRQQGIMHPDQVIAYLPLHKGQNLLRAIVSDRFGGWGLSGRLENCEDLEVQ